MLNTNTWAFKREAWSFHLWCEAIRARITGDLTDSVGCRACPTQGWSHIQINLMGRVIESTALCGTQAWDINKWLRPLCPSWCRWNAHHIKTSVKTHSWIYISRWAFEGLSAVSLESWLIPSPLRKTCGGFLLIHIDFMPISVGRREKEGRRNCKHGLLCTVYETVRRDLKGIVHPNMKIQYNLLTLMSF